MENLIFAIHLVTAVIIIGLILIQQGKGAEAGASFGAGASQTMFGSSGSWNFFSKLTAVFATVFFITSFTLAILARDNAGIDDEFLPELEKVQQKTIDTGSEIPAVDSADSSNEIPTVDSTDSSIDIPVPETEEIPVQ